MRAVLFDAVATLIRPWPSVGAVYARAAAPWGAVCAARALEAAFPRAYRELSPERFCGRSGLQTSEPRERRWWGRVVARTFERAGCATPPPAAVAAGIEAFSRGAASSRKASTYVEKTFRLAGWTPRPERSLQGHLDRPEPKGNWWNTLGSASLFLFLLQGATGIFLTVYYAPSPDHAYDSIQYIMTGVAFGWLVRGIHHWGATLMVIVVFIHMVRVFMTASYKYPREPTWLIGVGLLAVGSGDGSRSDRADVGLWSSRGCNWPAAQPACRRVADRCGGQISGPWSDPFCGRAASWRGRWCAWATRRAGGRPRARAGRSDSAWVLSRRLFLTKAAELSALLFQSAVPMRVQVPSPSAWSSDIVGVVPVFPESATKATSNDPLTAVVR